MVPITIILIFFSAAIIASVIPQDNSFVNAASVETLESSQDNLDEETDISSSLYPKCTADTFGEEDDVENTQNSQIFPRANACPVSGMITMPEAPPNKKEAPSADSKLQEAIPAHLSPLPEHRLCDFLHRHHLSCGGPVVQRNAFIFVMNCLTGTAEEIPAWGRFREAKTLGGFCCATRDAPGEGLARGYDCYRVAPYNQLDLWPYTYYLYWLRDGTVY